MHRVYFDGNDRTDIDIFGLWLEKSERELAKIPGGPKEGMTVTIYSVGEIEAEATLHWDSEGNSWTARPIGPFRENHESWDERRD